MLQRLRVFRRKDRMLPVRPPEQWIENKRHFWEGIILLLLIGLVTLEFPGEHSLLERLFRWLGIPLYSNPREESGWHFAGILAVIGFFYAFVSLLSSVSRHRFLLFVAAAMLLNYAPDAWLNLYQRTLAPGVYAVHTRDNAASCSYTLMDERISGMCTIQLTNRGGDRLELDAALVHRTFSKRAGVQRMPDIPVTEPVTLHPRQSTEVNLPLDYPLAGWQEISGSGATFKVKLSDGNRDRIF